MTISNIEREVAKYFDGRSRKAGGANFAAYAPNAANPETPSPVSQSADVPEADRGSMWRGKKLEEIETLRRRQTAEQAVEIGVGESSYI